MSITCATYSDDWKNQFAPSFGIMEKDSFIILQRVKGLQDLAANERNWNYLNWPSAHGVSFVCDLKILLHLSLKVLLICFFFGFSKKKKKRFS